MSKKKPAPSSPDEPRRGAEERLRAAARDAASVLSGDAQSLLRELQTQQAELNAQKKALRESERREAFLADLLEHSSQPFGVGYPDGRLGLMNTAYRQLLGYTGAELGALNWARE